MKTSAFRFDIQALRALAVALVLVYHVWPQWLPAGYIGVDVFFVISGFLITGVLIKSLERDGRIRFRAFYLRRFRRLMPAASVVIVATLGGAWLLEPSFRQSGTAMEGLASALYFQNWLLAVRATDYLDAERALGPLTHYWSLSIEEQFYLIWPLTLAVVAWLARRRGWPLRRLALVAIALISLGSLIASWRMASRDLPEAYFVTHTRVWELGLGALLALMPAARFRASVAASLSALALVVILASAMLIPLGAAFPGLVALVPTLATAVFLRVGADLDPAGALGWLAARPVQFLGDASYSIYLWHWPLIYFAALIVGAPADLAVGLTLLLVSLALGGVSKRLIEDPLRDRKFAEYSATRATRVTGVLFAISLLAAGALLMHSRGQIEGWEALEPDGDHPGAMVLSGDAGRPPVRAPIPAMVAVKDDLPVVYGLGCHTSPRSSEVQPCVLRESPTAASTVVILGDSHAANWVPAMEVAAENADWTLVSITKSACSVTLPTDAPAVQSGTSCLEWSQAVIEVLQEIQPEAVVLGRSRRGSDYASPEAEDWVPGLVPMLTEMLDTLSPLTDRLYVLADTPRLPFDPPTCLSEEGVCDVALKETDDRPDALLAAARLRDGVAIVDLRHLVCPDAVCRSLVGNVMVWRDYHHFTATYSRSMAPALLRRLQADWPDG